MVKVLSTAGIPASSRRPIAACHVNGSLPVCTAKTGPGTEAVTAATPGVVGNVTFTTTVAPPELNAALPGYCAAIVTLPVPTCHIGIVIDAVNWPPDAISAADPS